jgi:hypothetical protein
VGPDQNIWEKAIPGDEGFSLTRRVNWQNLQALFRDKQSGDKGGKLSQSRYSHLCQTSQKLLKPRGFKEVFLCMATRHPNPCRDL